MNALNRYELFTSEVIGMSWKEEYLSALDAAGLFENSGHRTRYKELLDCYGGYPFFTKGLCKCIYLAGWDEEHFTVMLETLAEMSLGRQRSTDEMSAKGESLAYEYTEKNGEFCMYLLSIALLEGKPFKLPEDVKLTPHYEYVISRALEASAVIDAIDIEITHEA
jgi:hypothetical protein